MRYKSIVGWGKAYIISREEERQEALNHLASKYLGGSYNYSKTDLAMVSVIKIEIEDISIKISE